MSPSENTLSDPLALGDVVLDRYKVVERLETGGTSVVYRGEDARLSRPVCIKVFHTLREKEWIYRTTYEHFVQEAFALSKLTHPNTLRIYDFGHLPPGPASNKPGDSEDPTEKPEEGPPFQVSEFMNGGTLSNVVRRDGPLPPPEAGQVVTAICGALDEAHTHGIIHRDIKPKNILFGTTGAARAPKLADFGIAKSLDLDSGQLSNRAGDTHVVAGRRLLMYSGLWAAPEQLVGQKVSGTSDIYSFALVTIYMLTGRCVFSSNDPSEAYRQRVDSDVLIDELFKEFEFPASVGVLLKQACALEAARRPQHASDFAKALIEAFENRGRRRLPLEAPHLTPVPAAAPVTAAGGTSVIVPAPSEGRAKRPTSPSEPPRNRRKTDQQEPRTAAAAPTSSGFPTPPSALTTAVGASPSAATQNAPSGPPQRLSLTGMPQTVGDRTAIFVPMDAGGSADIICRGGRIKLRVSLVPAPGGFTLHVRGLSCFVRKADGRPSGAVTMNEAGDIELVQPNNQRIATATVDFGSPAAGHHVFRVGEGLVALGVEECPRAVAFDFGPAAECVFVYVPRAMPVMDAQMRNRRQR